MRVAKGIERQFHFGKILIKVSLPARKERGDRNSCLWRQVYYLAAEHNPAKHFPILRPQNATIVVSELYRNWGFRGIFFPIQKCRSTGFEAQKMGIVRSGLWARVRPARGVQLNRITEEEVGNQMKAWLPDRPFHNLRASKSVDRRILYWSRQGNVVRGILKLSVG